MSTPAAGSPGDNKAFTDGVALDFPVVVSETVNDIKFNSVDYVIPEADAFIEGHVTVTFPVTIDSTHNEFGFAGVEYVIPAGVYENFRELADAVSNAVNGSVLFGTKVHVDADTNDSIRYSDIKGDGVTHAHVDSAAITLPLVVGTNSQSQFQLNSITYTIANGTYSTLATLAAAVNAAVQTDTTAFGLVAKATVHNTGLRFTSVAAGKNVLAFAAGAHDALALLGITVGWTLGHDVQAGVFTTGTSNDALGRIGLANNDAMAAIGYADARTLAKGLNSAKDNQGNKLSTVVKASASPFVDGAIRFTAAAEGVNVETFATGTVNDAIALVGLTNGQALANGAAATVEVIDSAQSTNETPVIALPVTGNGIASSIVAGTALALPITVDSTHNDFKFNSNDYTIASGVYATAVAFANAVNVATKSGGNLLNEVVQCEPRADGKLKFTARASGANTHAFQTGTTHDAIGKLGLANNDALAGGS